MTSPNLVFCHGLAAALADLGVEHACVSPGSRNTPLIAGFAAESRIRKWPILDERSAGFFGIGLARATGRPVALICTSGSAAAEYHPAVVEARQSDVPLLVLTADRPPELRDVGAAQTIDQVGLYGSGAVLFVDVPPPDESTTAQHGAELASRVVGVAREESGPVHINLPFREPLLDVGRVRPPQPVVPPPDPGPTDTDLSELAGRLNGQRGLIVVGRSSDPTLPPAVEALAHAAGAPVLADPLSGLRFADPGELVLGYGDALAAAGVLDELVADYVIRLGHIPTSKSIWTWLERNPQVPQILAGTAGKDATGSASELLPHSSCNTATALAGAIETPAPAEWMSSWLALDRIADRAISEKLERLPFPNEPAVARLAVDHAPRQASLMVGSSMPIRDVDTFGGKARRQLRLFGNRGTNGIDGVASAAAGAAAAGTQSIALIGDVSMFHDLNVLGTVAQLGLPVTYVVVNNDGGGIFHFLPQAQPELLDPAIFEAYVGTPHGTDFVSVARALGITAERIET
ncbi:MAG: 2-succinyl-5-enolpyruvyl-6-hydroxy-3-cyclohexene-1-carboxylic-acid synthase, partial [Acidimicrobiia bacterium]|nr:2-succinyl-5-enolpyruvyl-6-hydroxy-3-cyclohexene-1-carboxylic-acid synthase [Acidimicrobiia bacterium]